MSYFKSDDIERVLFTEEQLADEVAKLGAQITKDYAGKDLMVVGVLKGCAPFLVDLIRHIDLPLTMDFMAVSSYGSGTKTSGVVRILKDLNQPVEGKDLLIVEDILDSGMTLKYLTNLLSERNANSIRIATLMDKPERRKVDLHADYVGFSVPDAFIVGYGLDYAEQYRNLPYVGILSPKVYEKK